MHLCSEAAYGRCEAPAGPQPARRCGERHHRAELRTGAAKSASATKTLRLIENFLRPLAILEFTSCDAASYALVRAKLERAGTPIGPLDTLIAAHAVARGLVLVSSNEREFTRVAGLHVQNWTS